ncbi:Phage protein [Salmonella phage Tennessee]
MKRYLSVMFQTGGQRYTYEFPPSWKIREGDQVVVLTPREEYKVVTVKQVFPKYHEPAIGIRYKMIHGVVRQVPRTEVEVGNTGETKFHYTSYLDSV